MRSHVHANHYPLSTSTFVVGIDEAGRGPIAGPVAVAAVLFLVPPDRTFFDGVRDSKQLSEKKREYFESRVNEAVQKNFIRYSVQFSSSEYIDRFGIVNAIRVALTRALAAVDAPPARTNVFLDGSLKAPSAFLHQQTIIRGDETELPITLAGIMAKTARDREMHHLSTRFPQYGFEKHKGYGTKSHYQAIKAHGPCALHRTTFIT
ncbi:MAG: ribonuclease HII [Patescibacteria group bacterium]